MSQRERMTVLQLIPAMDSGGAEVCVLEQSRALVGAGHRVLVGSAGGRLESQLRAAGAEAVRLHCGMKSLHWFRSILQLRRVLLSERVDVVDVHSRLPAWCLWFVLRLLPARQRPLVVHTVHGLNSLGYYSRIMLRASCVVAVSECVREHLRVMAGGQQTAGVVVIYRGVDSQRFSRRWPQSDGWRAEYLREHPEAIGRFLLLLPGRLSRGKGHVDLIRLLADLRAVGVEVQALCPGNTSGREHYVSELQSLAAALRVSDCLVFPGLREDLESIYAGVDVVLSLSSSPESFSLTIGFLKCSEKPLNCTKKSFQTGADRGNPVEVRECALQICPETGTLWGSNACSF